MDKLEGKLEGGLYKVTDVHANHEATLYFNTQYVLERVMLNPPAPPMEEPIIKGFVAEAEEVPVEPFTWGNRIFIPTKDATRIPVHDFHKLIVLNMDGKNTLADILEVLSPEWPDITPEFLLRVVHNLKIRGWIRETEGEE